MAKGQACQEATAIQAVFGTLQSGFVKRGQLEFKTDNRLLFDFAVEEVPFSSFVMDAVTYDLHADPVMNEGNVMTEYEERFSAKGNKINKYILKRKPEGEAPVDVS